MEFGVNLHSEVIVIPRDYEYVGSTPRRLGDVSGLKWTNKYASLGANFAKSPYIIDGLNEKGLYVGLFYFPGWVGYQTVTAADADRSMAGFELPTWILGNFENVEEVRTNLDGIIVSDAGFQPWLYWTPPAHYIVRDASGGCIVIEYVDGKCNVYDNPLGVFTNSPGFDWHMTNLNNYVNLVPRNVEENQIGNLVMKAIGEGSGMLGLPGDFTPPSRFVRAAFFGQCSPPNDSIHLAVHQLFHLLNHFDLPIGSIRAEAEVPNLPPKRPLEMDGQSGEGEGTELIMYEYTEWTTSIDLSNRIFHFRTREDQCIRMVELMKQDLDASDIVCYEMLGVDNPYGKFAVANKVS